MALYEKWSLIATRTYFWRGYRNVQVLVLLDCGVACVVTNQILQGGEPLALARHIVLSVPTSYLVVKHSELFVEERQDKISRLTLTLTNQIGTWL